jgi:hypothetical protein
VEADVQRHDVDPTSLAFGLLFTIAGLMLLGGSHAAGTVSLGWTGPAVAIGLGLLIVAAVRPQKPRSTEDPDDEVDAGPNRGT